MNLFKSIQLVRAGRAGEVLPMQTKEISAKRISDCKNDIGDRNVYCVIGESMSPEGIYTDDLLVATKINQDENIDGILNYGTFIVLRIPDDKDAELPVEDEHTKLKMRKFIMPLNIRTGKDLWHEVQQIDKFSYGEDAKKIFEKKCDQARENIPQEEQDNVLLSITYTSRHGREYSFHSRKMLCAKVDFYIDIDNQIHYL